MCIRQALVIIAYIKTCFFSKYRKRIASARTTMMATAVTCVQRIQLSRTPQKNRICTGNRIPLNAGSRIDTDCTASRGLLSYTADTKSSDITSATVIKRTFLSSSSV